MEALYGGACTNTLLAPKYAHYPVGAAWPQMNTVERKMIAQVHGNEVKRFATRIGAIMALGLVTILPAAAQTYPARPVTLIVPFPAGGPIELLGRVIGTSLDERLGQPILVESRPGGSSTIGAGLSRRLNPMATPCSSRAPRTPSPLRPWQMSPTMP